MLAIGRHFVGARARMTHQPQVRGRHGVAKKSRNKKFKKISKRNLPNVGMGGWMEALADKGHKQGEHIPQHCYISHNHPYISSSDTLGGTISISTATYVGMVV